MTEYNYKQIQLDFEKLRQNLYIEEFCDDTKYVKGIHGISRCCEFFGRSLIIFFFDPVALGVGIILVFIHRALESLELGHNIHHGQYDGVADIPQFHSKNHCWKVPFDEQAWRRLHNGIHHVHTNVPEVDPDLYHGFMRISSTTPWSTWHLFQVPIYFLFLYPRMMYLYNIQLFGFFDAKRAKRFKSGNKGYAIYSGEDSKSQKIINKKKHHVSRSRLLIKEYVFFPVLSFFIGGSVVQVLIAHFIIDIAVNFWLTLCLEVGHIPKKLQKKDTVLNTGEWYVSQIESSINFKGNRIWTTLWGHLNYQIEHHLFPDLCSRKLRDASSSVQDLCRVHGIEYTLYPNWRSAILAFLKVFVRYSRRPKESEIKG